MIVNDQELKATQERIAQFQCWLAQIRQTARPEEFGAVASGYRAFPVEHLGTLSHIGPRERYEPHKRRTQRTPHATNAINAINAADAIVSPVSLFSLVPPVPQTR